MPNHRIDFFASANSGCGFINSFGDIFSSLHRIYIIKGGSGTGKSYFMKKAAAIADKLGYTTEYCLCSSDPDSLDGIIIREIGVGIIDGTAPHIADPRYPGAYDEIINTGDFWDSDILTQRRNDIKYLTDKKTEIFSNAYTYLRAAYNIETLGDTYIDKCYNRKKAGRAIERLLASLPVITNGEVKNIFTEALSMKGRRLLRPYKNAISIYSVKSGNGIGHIFMSELEAALSDRCIARCIGHNALDIKKINMIYIEGADILFEINSPDSEAQSINMQRFTDKEALRNNREYIRNTERLKNILTDRALTLMSEIKDIHFALEDIYTATMNFEEKEEYEKRVLTKIFGSY